MDSIMPTEREFGELSERVRFIQSDMASLKSDMTANTRATNEILKRIAGLDGGWKTLAVIGSVAAVIGGMVVKYLPAMFHV